MQINVYGFQSEFWIYYIEKNGWKNIVNMVFGRDSKPLPQQNTGEIYLINEIMTTDTFGRSKYLYHEDFCSPSRKVLHSTHLKSITGSHYIIISIRQNGITI